MFQTRFAQVGVPSSTTKVSSFSSRESSVIFTEILPVVEPAGIVRSVVERALSRELVVEELPILTGIVTAEPEGEESVTPSEVFPSDS